MTSILTDFGVNLPALITSIVNFTLLAVILWYVMIKPLLNILEQRSETIRTSLERAEFERQEAGVLAAKIAGDRKLAVEQARTMLADAEAKAALIVKRAATDAEAKVAAILMDAAEQATRERHQLMDDATRQLGDLVVDATRIVIGKTVTPELDQTIIRSALNAARTKS